MSARTLVSKCIEQNIVIATAESCTAGLISGAITDIAGSSAVLDRGFVTYSNDAKKEMLGVRAATLECYGAVSEEVAKEMSEGALSNSNATVAIAVTGIAGPGGSEHKPEGRVCFGLSIQGKKTLTETQDFGPIGRESVRKATVKHALDMILSQIIQQ